MESQENRGCLICGKKAKNLNRGLCSTHHSRYYAQVRKMTADQKVAYERALIENGYLLPLQKRGPKVSEDPFALIALELLAAEDKATYEAEPKKKATKRADKKQ